MIFIVLKISIRPERRDDWLANIKRYTDAVREEPGNLEFACFESIETPNQFSIVEAFASSEAGDEHVKTEHFKEFLNWFPTVIAASPQIINTQVEGWSEMHELKPSD